MDITKIEIEQLELEIGWLEKLLNGLRTIEEKEFSYSRYVSSVKRDSEDNICGTICCAYGWIPRFVPEAGVEWEERESGGHTINTLPMQLFIKTPPDLRQFMFSGSSYDIESMSVDEYNKNFGASIAHVELHQVINRIEYAILESKKLLEQWKTTNLYRTIHDL